MIAFCLTPTPTLIEFVHPHIREPRANVESKANTLRRSSESFAESMTETKCTNQCNLSPLFYQSAKQHTPETKILKKPVDSKTISQAVGISPGNLIGCE